VPQTAAEKPVPVPAVKVVAPEATARSGVLYRIGLKSDLVEFAAGAPGTLWIVASGDHAELLQGPVVIRAEGGGASGGSFQVQAGAFSQEETAKKLADKLAAALSTNAEVAFSADKGLYRVLLGGSEGRAEADALLEKLKAQGHEGFVVPGAPRAPAAPVSITALGAGASAPVTFPSPVDVFPPAPDARVTVDGVAYRGSVRILVNARGTLNVVNRVDIEDYLYGVVPAEMGPKRYDAIEALKAQAIAARTYAFAHRAQFDSEGFDICATAKCQAYGGVAVEDPLSTAAVDGTRGLVLAFENKYADALFVSTCGGVTENVENVFSGGPLPYLVSVECGELKTDEVPGAAVPKDGGAAGRSVLEWRGYILRHYGGKRPAVRAAALETAQRWAGVPRHGSPPARLTPAAVYPSIVEDFGLTEARGLQVTPRDDGYFSEHPSALVGLSGAARSSYALLLRFRFASDALPPPDRDLREEEYAGLLLSVALRLLGATESSGRFLSREGGNIWVKTAEGRQGLPVDPEVPMARKIGDRYYPASTLRLRAGDRLRWIKNGPRLLALWVEMDADGPTFERESAWTEWVRRVPARELARRMAGRVAGNEVKEIEITKRSPTGRAIEMHVKTDLAEATFKRFDLRQAVEMPELLFSVSKVEGPGPGAEAEFVFLGRGWGHGVGLCQNGSFGMALAGETYDAILRHYYTGIEIVPAASVTGSTAPSTR